MTITLPPPDQVSPPSMASPGPTCRWSADTVDRPGWRWRDEWSGNVASAGPTLFPWPPATPAPAVAPGGDHQLAGTGPASPVAPAQLVARRWADTVVEALNGRRPPTQLVDWFDAATVATVRRHSREYRQAGGVQLASVRAQAPRPQVIEVCLRLVVAGRVRAAALCLTRHEGRWRGGDLVLG